jgi:hypothetical protein
MRSSLYPLYFLFFFVASLVSAIVTEASAIFHAGVRLNGNGERVQFCTEFCPSRNFDKAILVVYVGKKIDRRLCGMVPQHFAGTHVAGSSEYLLFRSNESIVSFQRVWVCETGWICYRIATPWATQSGDEILGRNIAAVFPNHDRPYAAIIRHFNYMWPWKNKGALNIDQGGMSVPVRVAHFAQLPMHDVQLPVKNYASYNTNCDKGSSKYSYPPSPSRHYEVAIGFFLLGAATATVFVAFKVTEYTDDYWPAVWWLPLFGGLALAFWLADHALSYFMG